MAARRAQFYHITRDAGVMSRLNAKRFAARGEGGQVSASEAAARANLQMEPEDRPPVMLEGLGTGSGDPCGPRWDVTDPQRYSLATPGGGMNRLNFLIQALNRLDDGFPRSRQQQEFHRAFIGACLNNIVGQIDLAANLSRLMEQFNLEEVRSDLIIYTARRMGKTMGVCLFAGAYLYTQPSCQISVYSPGHRASFKILGTVHRIVVFLAGGDDKRSIHRGNAETMQVFGTGEHASTLHAYPSDIRVSVPPQRPLPIRSNLHRLCALGSRQARPFPDPVPENRLFLRAIGERELLFGPSGIQIFRERLECRPGGIVDTALVTDGSQGVRERGTLGRTHGMLENVNNA